MSKRVSLVAVRSTVLPGTAEGIVIPALERTSGKRLGKDFGVCVNPEFMRGGTAVADFLEPAMTIIGTADAENAALLRKLYAWALGRMSETSFRSAEMVKYVCNAWHVVKVSFANEVGTLAKELGVDAQAVIEILTADTKLNIAVYLSEAGLCLWRVLSAQRRPRAELSRQRAGSQAASVRRHPAEQRQAPKRAIGMVLDTGNRNVAILGLSFKAPTDDLWESPQV
jgi:GDP-mannose 6-dehydrogenase